MQGGQIAAALAAGNAVIEKPSSSVPLICQRAVQLGHLAGASLLVQAVPLSRPAIMRRIMMGAGLFTLGFLAGITALIVLAVTGEGIRPVWTIIQTCLILGSVLFATGLLGEQIAGQRAEVRELRRQLDEMKVRSEQ